MITIRGTKSKVLIFRHHCPASNKYNYTLMLLHKVFGQFVWNETFKQTEEITSRNTAVETAKEWNRQYCPTINYRIES